MLAELVSILIMNGVLYSQICKFADEGGVGPSMAGYVVKTVKQNLIASCVVNENLGPMP